MRACAIRSFSRDGVWQVHQFVCRTPMLCGGKPAQCLYRWDEVIGTTDSRRIFGQGITYAILGSRHPSEHAGQALLVAAEADKHRPMLSGRPERGIAAKDVLFYTILFDHRARDVRLVDAASFRLAGCERHQGS